ncbi:MAG: hypothetical protein JWR48_3793 [Mycobacterium sp.]|nr:hypothetical protein [Mycobacterium sp.]
MDTVVLTPSVRHRLSWTPAKVQHIRGASNENVRSPAGTRRHDVVSVDGGRDYRDAGSELGAMRERRVVGSDGERMPAARRAAGSAMRCWPVVGPDGERMPAAGRRATTLGVRRRPVVGPDGECMPAAGRRGATARMRQRLVVGSDRQRLPSATITAGRLANSGGSYLTRALQRYRARAAGRFSRAQTPPG